jgi:hypothetical protein
MQLTDNQRNALQVICSAIIPSIQNLKENTDFWTRSCHDLGVADTIMDVVNGLKVEDQDQIKQLLQLMSTTWAACCYREN